MKRRPGRKSQLVQARVFRQLPRNGLAKHQGKGDPGFLPDEEGAQLSFEFERELARLKAA